MKKIGMIILLIGLGFYLTSCNGTGDRKNSRTINLGYVNWAEGVAMAHVAKVILEEKGYKVNMMNTDAAPLFASLAKGSADIFLETWMPVTHKEYMEKYGDKIDVLGVVYDNARIGLVVPDYVSVNSIDQLNQYKDKFNKKIVGIDAGAGIMQATEKAIKAYDLDFDLQTSSESGMTASLKKAIDKGNWIVVTGWTPHWIFSRYKVKMLEDPRGIYGSSEKIEAVSRKGFEQDEPWVAHFVKNIKYTDEEINNLMDLMDKAGNEDVAAKKWVTEHPDLVNSWLPPETDSNPE